MPNGGHGDLFAVRSEGSAFEPMCVLFHGRDERVLASGLTHQEADDFMWGAIHAFDNPDLSPHGKDRYREGFEVGLRLRDEYYGRSR
jgi:hypothetical protein